MNAQDNNENMEQTDRMAVISDVKHYAIEIDADGNEVRREIPAFDIPSESFPTEAKPV